MDDEDEKKEKLINEVKHLPQQITKLKALKAKRKRAEEVLRESESGYIELADLLPQPVFEMDERGDLTFANRNAFEAFGYTQEDFIKGVNAINLVIPEDRDRAENNMQRILSGEKLGGNEYMVMRKDGSTFPVIIHSAPIIHEGKAVGLRGIMIDITERKRAEEALKESEGKFKTLAEQSPSMIFINKKGRVVYANKKCEELMGYTREEFYSPDFDFLCLIAPESIKKVKSSFARHEKGAEVEPYEYSLITKEGKRIEAIINTTLIIYEKEKAILGTVTDITERKRAEEELKKSEERYRSLVEDINDGYFIIQDGKFVYINQAFADLSGYTKEGMLGMECVRLFPQKYLERLSKDNLKRKEDREHVVQNEFEILRKDEEHLVLEIRSRVIDYHGRSAIAGICKNITERKKAEMALKEKVKELEKWYQITVDREIKMTQLKNRIQELESKGSRKRE